MGWTNKEENWSHMAYLCEMIFFMPLLLLCSFSRQILYHVFLLLVALDIVSRQIDGNDDAMIASGLQAVIRIFITHLLRKKPCLSLCNDYIEFLSCPSQFQWFFFVSRITQKVNKGRRKKQKGAKSKSLSSPRRCVQEH